VRGLPIARPPIRSLGLVAVLTLAAGSCGTNAPTGFTDGTVAPSVGGRLIVAVPTESNGWNPVMNQWSESGTLVATSMIEPLAIADADGKPQAWLAERWESNPDFTQWDITVREGVVFHDGTPLDATAVKRNMDAAYQTGLTQFGLRDLYDHVEVMGPRTVRTYLKVRWAQFPATLTNSWVMAPAMLDREDRGVTDPVGTGPFRFERWVQTKTLTAKRFARYWRRDASSRSLPYLDEIEFRVIEDDADRERALQAGEVDLALSTAGRITTDLRGGSDVITDDDSEHTFLMLNSAVGEANRTNPFPNAHARRALAYATDRGRIADRVGPGLETRNFGFYQSGSPWQPRGGDGYVDYDPGKAREEIEAYKRDTGAPQLSFRLSGPTSTEEQALLLALQAQWAEVGIAARVEAQEPPKLIILATLGDYDATWFRFSAFPDPDLMNFYYSSSTVRPVGELSLNFTRWSSPEVDGYLKTLRETTDPGPRKTANDALIRATNREAITIWLYNTPISLIARPKVRGLDGFRSHPFGNPQPKPWLAEAWLAA
jgi:peptide/nickel transport system substrate-binding protein